MSRLSALVARSGGEFHLQVIPLLARKLNLSAGVISEDNLLRIGEIDRRTTTLDAAHSDHPNLWGVSAGPPATSPALT